MSNETFFASLLPSRHWLMKSEPETFSIEDLEKKKASLWDGVRNYTSRNFMQNEMKIGDQILFYHSSCEIPGVAGLARVSKMAQPDPTQFDKKSEYYDKGSKKENPRWQCVEVEFVSKFPSVLPLTDLKGHKELSNLILFRPGLRLSIFPVSKNDFDYIVSLTTK